MQDFVNKIFNYLQSKNCSVQANGSIKKVNSRKPMPALDFYKDNMADLLEFTPQVFMEAIKQLTVQKSEEVKSFGSLGELMANCGFIYEKFRWFVTREKTKIYYLKTNPNAEEYFYLTTDRESPKFFNSLNLFDLDKVNQLVTQFNALNPEDTIDCEKLVKAIISDIRQNPAYCLPKEPVTLSNDPTEPCFKFFDIEGLERWGDEYMQQYGTRPPTPAWDCFFARIREQMMVPLTKAYLAGLFVAKNTAKQALYIFGNGNDGKSQITECLAKKMGEDITFMLPQNMKANQFTLFAAYGKRMFLGEELQSPNVIKNGMLHAILGGSRVWLEPKNEAPFFGKVYCCGVITSNYSPLIDDVKNQISRLIYIEMNPPTDEEINQSGKEWAIALQHEFEGIIYEGLKYFKNLNPSGASYRMPEDYRDILLDLFDEKSRHMSSFIEEVFVEDPEGEIRTGNLIDAFISFVKTKYFDPNDLSVPTEYRDSRISKEVFEKLLIRFPKIKKDRKRLGLTQFRIIRGLSISQEHCSLIEHFDSNSPKF